MKKSLIALTTASALAALMASSVSFAAPFFGGNNKNDRDDRSIGRDNGVRDHGQGLGRHGIGRDDRDDRGDRDSRFGRDDRDSKAKDAKELRDKQQKLKRAKAAKQKHNGKRKTKKHRHGE